MVNILFTTYKCTFTFQVFFVECHSIENRGVYVTISYKADQRLYHYVTIVERHRECDLTNKNQNSRMFKWLLHLFELTL